MAGLIELKRKSDCEPVRNCSLADGQPRRSRHSQGLPNSQAQRDEAVAVLIVLLEHIRHPLQADARLHEQIEAQHPAPARVVGREEQAHVLGREAVAEGDEGVAELAEGDCAAAVDVEAVEQEAPLREEAP